VFSTSENVPPAVASSLEELQPQLAGSTVIEFLSTLSDMVENILSSDENDKTAFLSDYFSDDGTELIDQGHHIGEPASDDELLFSPSSSDSELKAKLRHDLLAAKAAGFRVGYLGDLTGAVIITISCRISKLGISEEAMQAWGVHPRQYLVLLIRYPRKYLDFDEILREESKGSKLFVQMHVGLCDFYKPNLASALQAFVPLPNTAQNKQNASAETDRKLTPFFIDKPLQNLLNERFVKIVSYRYTCGLSWAGAELYFNNSQGKILDAEEITNEEYSVPDNSGSSAPRFLDDHMSDTLSPARLSFPLLAMQFTLRHFVKCTEFCLVCHCKTDTSFEALKPYVCSKPLCLYQYMALGMGPSIEWEILSQPYVVDLLISFTYASAIENRLKDFPTGLGLKVPGVEECVRDFSGQMINNNDSLTSQLPAGSYAARLNIVNMELILPSKRGTEGGTKGPPLRPGDWIVIIAREVTANVQLRDHWHCRVQSTDNLPFLKLSDPVIRAGTPVPKNDIQRGVNQLQSVVFVPYDDNFDNLPTDRKRRMIMMLLETLPDVKAMKAFLSDEGNDSERRLSSWRDRISGPALDVLRWIIASNRSFIMQDELDPNDHAASNDNLVSGMEGYMQFRFVQGAPDKEQRFVDSVNATAARLELKHPTLFAWHGSPLSNWHSIVREGLHFKYTANGRSCGHGVYMSPYFMTSSSYCGGVYGASRPWPNSALGINTAISLNEVVNAPQEFVNRNPHYVVNQLDWIQPRYLFVQCVVPGNNGQSTPQAAKNAPSAIYNQDPKHLVHGPKGKIDIPITALSQRRREACEFSTTATTKKTSPRSRKRKSGAKAAVEDDNDDAASVKTDDEDLLILLPDPEDNKAEEEDAMVLDEPEQTVPTKGKFRRLFSSSRKKNSTTTTTTDSGPPKTDFKPGTLTESSLKLFAPPTYATSSATKILQQHLQATLKIQDATPLHELGWSIDPNLISTVYQWIVEFHTFDADLPLAKDLKTAGLHSVVLELRFPKDFPMSPPFVRVIRPRFLEFQRGGGGHVTAGGALCMELLTNTGWSPASSIESVLLQVRLALSSTEPVPARLQQSQKKGKAGGGGIVEYSVAEAVEAYMRASRAHGWEIPKDFLLMNWA
jgi:ubiquitin-conjugating enzyme E2 Q